MPVHDFDRSIDRRGGDSIKWNAYPEDVLPMWVADSDFRAPEPVVQALIRRADQGVYGYSDPLDAEFRRAVAHWMQSRFAWPVREEWVAFAPSVVISLMLSVLAFTRKGDAVLFMTPAYPPFFSVPAAHGRTALTSALLWEQGRYCIDFADLEGKLARTDTRLLFLCNPHNPTGRVFSREELVLVGELCRRHDVLVLSDEIHCDYVFAQPGHLPFPLLGKECARHCLVAVNPSKTFNIADVQCSAVISENPEILERFKEEAARHFLHSNAFGNLALKTAYLECAWYADQVATYVKGNLDLAASFINERIPGITTYVPEATYLLWLDCRAMGLPQKDLEAFFLDKAKLGLNSGVLFGPEGEGFMRMNLACPRATLLEALGRLERAAGQGRILG